MGTDNPNAKHVGSKYVSSFKNDARKQASAKHDAIVDGQAEVPGQAKLLDQLLRRRILQGLHRFVQRTSAKWEGQEQIII